MKNRRIVIPTAEYFERELIRLESPSTAGNTKGQIYFEQQKRTVEDPGRSQHSHVALASSKRALPLGGFNLNEQLT